MKKKLYNVAHCRAGDKGNTSILSLIAYRDKDYALLCAKVTAAAVKRHLGHLIRGKVTRHEVANVGALQFVCEQSLGGGVTTSLAMDAHGKSLSYALLEMEIEV
ncbi:MAG: hypothetical protein JWN94_4081 [Betaproteobacteria bacterium]|nr:hypothetical protein [Betaproteobacteria bacterium]